MSTFEVGVGRCAVGLLAGDALLALDQIIGEGRIDQADRASLAEAARFLRQLLCSDVPTEPSRYDAGLKQVALAAIIDAEAVDTRDAAALRAHVGRLATAVERARVGRSADAPLLRQAMAVFSTLSDRALIRAC